MMDVLKWQYRYRNGKMVKIPVWGSTRPTNFKVTPKK